MFNFAEDFETGSRSPLSITADIVRGVLYILLGVLVLLMPSSPALVELFFILFGLVIVVLNVFPCILYFILSEHSNYYLVKGILSLISVITGFMIMFPALRGPVFDIIIGVWFIGMPIARICLSDDKKKQAKKEIPWFIVAGLLLFLGFDAVKDIACYVFGGLLCAAGIILIILALIDSRPKKDKPEKKNPSPYVKDDAVIIDAEVKDI